MKLVLDGYEGGDRTNVLHISQGYSTVESLIRGFSGNSIIVRKIAGKSRVDFNKCLAEWTGFYEKRMREIHLSPEVYLSNRDLMSRYACSQARTFVETLILARRFGLK